jgi:hypothetical protein
LAKTGKLPYFFISNLLILTLYISGCHMYSFTGASIAPDVKTVTIQYFPNNAALIQPSLSQVFTEKLKDKFVSQTNLNLVNKGGDLYFDGAITGYDIKPVAIQGNDQAALNRLTITVRVKFINNKNEKQNFETSFSRYTDYASTKNLSTVEDELIRDVTTQLVGDVFNKAVINW